MWVVDKLLHYFRGATETEVMDVTSAEDTDENMADAENRDSDSVVMTDISETSEGDPLAASSEHDEERAENGTVITSSLKSSPLSSDSNSVVSVPVSLPVGTLITGTTFNVITDQLPHFKPMLCVDNGFISGGSVPDDIKTTHILIQNPPSLRTSRAPPEETTGTAPTTSTSSRSWAETANMAILPIRCKSTPAELHKHKFGSGGRGKCIKHGLAWYTPSEFEAKCGRASSKDWKRSIRFGGRSIQALIDEGILMPHATSCTCGVCCNDEAAMGPVRLFTPYKRRRRNPDVEERKAKIKRGNNILCDSDIDNINQETSNNSNSKEAWQTLTEGLDGSTSYHLLENPPATEDSTVLAELLGVLKRVTDITQTMVQLVGDMKRCVNDVRVLHTRLERVEQERNSTLFATVADAQVESEQVSLHNVEDSDNKRCGNCNREASSECSICRRKHYCSTYCQKKDWYLHQKHCGRVVPDLHQDTQSHQPIMLIVENQHM